MKKQQGLTLAEILVSLCLVSSLSLGILSQNNRLALLIAQHTQSLHKLLATSNSLEDAYKSCF